MDCRPAPRPVTAARDTGSAATWPASGIELATGWAQRIVPNFGATTTAPRAECPTPTPTAQKHPSLSYAEHSALQDLRHPVAAGGRALVTLVPKDQIVPWQDTGRRLAAASLDGDWVENDLANEAVISRDGQYLTFSDQPFSDMEGKRHVPGSCPDPDGMSATAKPCQVVYDRVARRGVLGTEYAPLPRIGQLSMNIDPNDQVLGLVRPDSLEPTTAAGQRSTLCLLGLRTGKLLRKAVLPWRSGARFLAGAGRQVRDPGRERGGCVLDLFRPHPDPGERGARSAHPHRTGRSAPDPELHHEPGWPDRRRGAQGRTRCPGRTEG